MMDAAPEREMQEVAPVVTEPPRGQRGIRGLYSGSQRGHLGADGSFLDSPCCYDYVVASAWHDPACERMTCWRPEVLWMVPPEARRCLLHGRQTPPSVNPFPLEGPEWLAAEAKAWAALAPKYGVPLRYANVSFDGCQATPALEAARTYVASDDEDSHMSGGMFLQGGPGAGKTTALHAALRALVIEMTKNGRKDNIRFYSFPQLSRLLLDEDERDETLEACCEADELILDDLFAGYTKTGGFVVSLFEEIVIAREAALAPLLAASNLTPQRFRVLAGDRVYDRVAGSWGRWIDVNRPSLRTKPGKKAGQ
jgi:DNA replication protein DnaC